MGILVNSTGLARTTAKRDRQMLYFNRGVVENGNIWRVGLCASWLLLLVLVACFRNLARELDEIYKKWPDLTIGQILGFRNRIIARYALISDSTWSLKWRNTCVGCFWPKFPFIAQFLSTRARLCSDPHTKANGENRPIYGRGTGSLPHFPRIYLKIQFKFTIPPL